METIKNHVPAGATEEEKSIGRYTALMAVLILFLICYAGVVLYKMKTNLNEYIVSNSTAKIELVMEDGRVFLNPISTPVTNEIPKVDDIGIAIGDSVRIKSVNTTGVVIEKSFFEDGVYVILYHDSLLQLKTIKLHRDTFDRTVEH